MVAAGLHTRDVAGPVLLERELSELAQAARDAVAGEGGLVLISGEAGIGKSSLVRTLRGLLPANGRLLVGHCDDLLEQVMSRYREPLLRAAFHLQSRVYNIVEQAFLLRYLQRGSPAEQEYACRNTMFVLAEYLGWVEMLRRGCSSSTSAMSSAISSCPNGLRHQRRPLDRPWVPGHDVSGVPRPAAGDG
jgi:AAA ATPase-like protein